MFSLLGQEVPFIAVFVAVSMLVLIGALWILGNYGPKGGGAMLLILAMPFVLLAISAALFKLLYS